MDRSAVQCNHEKMVEKSPQNVVLYARHSSDKQWRSTRDQIDRCQAFAERSGYRVAQVFRDEELSGDAVITRSGVRSLVEAAFNGQFERVVIEDLSRISRDIGDVAHLYKRLQFLDIVLESVTEGVINELHIGLKSTMNALFLKDLADKTRRGNIAAVLLGGIPGGVVYGYDVVRRLDEHGKPIRGVRRVNEDQAEVVREIFRRFAAGESAKAISERLNARGVRSPKGGRWHRATLAGAPARQTGLLRQTLYKGVVTFNRHHYRKHPETGKRVAVLRETDEWIGVPAPELAIMEDELFEAVQSQLAARSTGHVDRGRLKAVLTSEERAAKTAAYERERQAEKNEAKGRFMPLVSGKLVCTAHEEPMHTIRSRLYNCPVKGCPNRNLRLERELMPLVLESLYAFDADAVLGDLSRFDGRREKLGQRIEALSRELEREREEIGHILDELGKMRKMQSVTGWLEKRERRVRRIVHDLERAEDERWFIGELTPASRTGITRAYRAELARVVTEGGDGKPVLTGTRTIRPWVESFRVTAEWDDGALPRPDGSRWKHRLEVRYDLHALLRALRPRRGKRRSR